jgi:hypothetical protein
VAVLRRLVAGAALLLGLCSFAAAEPSHLDGAATIRFTGSSTLHEFSGTAPPAAFVVEQAADGSFAATVDVPTAGLTTDNSWRDSNMRAMLHADSNPVVRAIFSAVVPDVVKENGRLPFRLRIASVERELVAEVSGWEQGADRAALDARFTVSLDGFGLTAPGALFMRVDDAVRVEVHVVLTRR